MTPEHIAIIMDGNGRWAKARGLPRAAGHKAGVEALQAAVRAVGERGIRWMTIYAFSSENWSRPQQEINDLMGLFRLFIRRDLADLHRNGVRVRMIGDRKGLQPDIASMVQEAEALTVLNSRMNLNIAFNYGGRDDIVRAVTRLAHKVKAGTLAPEAITERDIDSMLDTAGMPDPDLLIRTSGEQRLSNFLLWQAAYAEFVFLDVNWPDFGGADLDRALAVFAQRERRFGGIGERDAS